MGGLRVPVENPQILTFYFTRNPTKDLDFGWFPGAAGGGPGGSSSFVCIDGRVDFFNQWALVLGDVRTIPSKFSMPASYFRGPRTVKIEWGGRALPLHISIFGRSGIPSKVESKRHLSEVRAWSMQRARAPALRAGEVILI